MKHEFRKKKHQNADILNFERVKQAVDMVVVCTGVDTFFKGESSNTHRVSEVNGEFAAGLNDVVDNFLCFDESS